MKSQVISRSISFKNIFAKIFLLWALFLVARILFLMCNCAYFFEESRSVLLLAFWIGVRVDFAVIFSLNLPIFILWYLLVHWKTSPLILWCMDCMFFIINFFALLVNIIDAKYFSFTFRRMSGDIFNELIMLCEGPGIYIKMLEHFWYVVLVGFGIFVALYFISFKLPIVYSLTRSRFREYLAFFVIVVLGIIGIRGGLQHKPLKAGDIAACTLNLKTVHLANNTAFNILHTYQKTGVPDFENFKLDDKAFSMYSPIHATIKNTNGRFREKNIFIIILESFSAEYVGALDEKFKSQGCISYTPFLDTLIKKSYIFDAFANGSTSIDGLTSIVAGIPPLFGSAYIVSKYTENSFDALPALLERMGYSTVFFYGGKKNSCNFDSLRIKAGIDNYYCQDDYTGPSKDIRGWGVHDDKFLQFVANKMSDIKSPFLSVLFTLSSHHPFIYSEEFHGRFPKNDHPLPELIAYTDYSLQKFFETIEQTSWYKDTIFVLVADHISAPQQAYYNNKLGGYSIPLIIFDPNGELVGQSDTVIQQIDIMPTILNLLG